MRSVLKLAVVLFCVQTGEGRWLRALTDQRPDMASAHTTPSEDEGSGGTAEEHSQREGSAVRSSFISAFGVPARARRSTPEGQCSLRSIQLQVRDLGLGYDSDETILFKYCSGTCPRIRSNHDLTLSNLLLSGMLPQQAPGEMRHSAPCCRATHHEDMAFLDNSHRWHKVEKVLAAGCTCVG